MLSFRLYLVAFGSLPFVACDEVPTSDTEAGAVLCAGDAEMCPEDGGDEAEGGSSAEDSGSIGDDDASDGSDTIDGRVADDSSIAADASDSGKSESTMDAAYNGGALASADSGGTGALDANGNGGADSAIGDAGTVSDAASGSDAGGGGPFVVPCAVPPIVPGPLLDVGHSATLKVLQVSAQRILTQEDSRWILWNKSNGTMIADGTACLGSCQPARLSANLLAVRGPSTIELHNAVDGHTTGFITNASETSQYGLAVDGSYLWIASMTSLRVFGPTGTPLFEKTGNYGSAKVFAEPSDLRIALGPAGSDVIETFSVATGTPTTSIAFAGAFSAWFNDGQRFATTAASIARVYSKGAVQQKLLAVSAAAAGGYGDRLWIYTGGNGQPKIEVYAVDGDSTALLSEPAFNGNDSSIVSSSRFVALLRASDSGVRVIDLDASTPELKQISVPSAYLTPFAANADGDWAVADRSGVVYLTAEGGAPRALNCGAIGQVALAHDGTWAASVSANQVVLGNVSDGSSLRAIPFRANRIALSDDGARLMAVADDRLDPWNGDMRSLRIYTLPSAAIVKEISWNFNEQPVFYAAEMSPDGTRWAQLWGNDSQSAPHWTISDIVGNVTVRPAEIAPVRRVPILRRHEDDRQARAAKCHRPA